LAISGLILLSAAGQILLAVDIRPSKVHQTRLKLVGGS